MDLAVVGRRGPRRRRADGRRTPHRCRSRSGRRWSRRWPAGRPAGGHRRARSPGTAPGRRGPARSATSDTRVAPARAAASTAAASKPGSTVSGRARDHGPGHHGQAADVGQRQAGQPVVAGRPRRAGRWWPVADATTASWVSTTPLRLARRAARGHDQGVARLDRTAARRGAARRRRRASAAGGHGLRAAPAGRRAAGAASTGQRGVATVPDPLEGLDEGRAAGQGQRRPGPAWQRTLSRCDAGPAMMPDFYGDVYAPVTWERPADHDYRDISYETSPEGIAKITICRPEVRNAFRPADAVRAGRCVQPRPRRRPRRRHRPHRAGHRGVLLRRRPAHPGRRRLHRRRRGGRARGSAGSTCSTCRSRSAAPPSRSWPWWPAMPSAAATSSTSSAT